MKRLPPASTTPGTVCEACKGLFQSLQQAHDDEMIDADFAREMLEVVFDPVPPPKGVALSDIVIEFINTYLLCVKDLQSVSRRWRN